MEKKKFFRREKNRRAVSQVVGGLFMLAIVIPIGIVLLSSGIHEATNLEYKLTQTGQHKLDAIKEEITFENIWFNASGTELEISILNTGNSEIAVKKIKMIKIDTQDLIVDWDDLTGFYFVKGNVTVSINATSLGSDIWNSTTYKDSEYRVSITTSRDNFFDTIARPFNT